MNFAELARLQKKVARYVLKMRDSMWLGRWRIEVRVDDLENLAGRCEPWDHRHVADITIAIGTATEGGANLRHTVVHELVHLYFRDMHDLVRLGLLKELNQSAYNLFYEAYRQSMELTVEELSHSWAEILPLPDWGND